MKFWIKERHNPQTGTYFIGCGKLSAAKAKRHERALYGDNIMHAYTTEQEYSNRLQQLRDAGERVQ